MQGADPNPPYTGLIELHFSLDSITIFDREGQTRRRQSKSGLNNCCLSDDAEIEIEYQTRGGDIRAEALSMNVVRETAVDMYKRRTRLSNPISMLTREPHLSWHT